MSKNPPTAAQVARNERIRVASLEGAKARAEFDAKDVAVRKNMERLRTLRLAKEADVASQPQVEKPKKKTRGKKAAVSASTLSDFLSTQKSSGRAT